MRYFLGEKGTAKPIKTVLGTSQVLLLLSFCCDDLKPESANSPQTALKFMWCRYSFWQRLPRNNGCAKPTPFYWEFCQSIKIMVAERERVSRLVKDITSTPVGVPLPSYRYGRRLGVYT